MAWTFSPEPAPFSTYQVVWKVLWLSSEEEEHKVKKDKAEYSNNHKAFSTWSGSFFYFFKYRYIPDRSASRYTVPTLQLRLLGLTSKMVEEHRDSTQFLIFITLHASLISRTSLHHLHFNQGTKLDTVCLCKLGVLFLTKLSGKSAVKQHSSGEKKKKWHTRHFYKRWLNLTP